MLRFPDYYLFFVSCNFLRRVIVIDSIAPCEPHKTLSMTDHMVSKQSGLRDGDMTSRDDKQSELNQSCNTCMHLLTIWPYLAGCTAHLTTNNVTLRMMTGDNVTQLAGAISRKTIIYHLLSGIVTKKPQIEEIALMTGVVQKRGCLHTDVANKK